MTMNLIVPFGEVQFNFFDSKKQFIKSFIIGEKNYSRITVPPMIWFGFKGLSEKTSYILNISDKLHDPKEVERKPLSFLKFFESYEGSNSRWRFGTRISEYTSVIPKPMIPINGNQ